MSIKNIEGTTSFGMMYFVCNTELHLSSHHGLFICWPVDDVHISKVKNPDDYGVTWSLCSNDRSTSLKAILTEDEALLFADALGCEIKIIERPAG